MRDRGTWNCISICGARAGDSWVIQRSSGPYSSRLPSVLRRSLRGEKIELTYFCFPYSESSSWLALPLPQFTNETDLEKGNDLPKTVRLVTLGASWLKQCSFCRFILQIHPHSVWEAALSPTEMGLTVIPSLRAPLSGSLSSPGHATNLQILVCGTQPSMSRLSLHP